MSVRRATRFIDRVITVTLVAIFLVLLGAVVERFFHPFTPLIDRALAWVDKTEALLGEESLMGLSLGMIVLTVSVCLIPLFLPRVNKTQYRTSTVRSVLASVVFFFTQILYGWAESFGRLHLIGAMLLAVVATLVIIEFLALLTRDDQEVSLRTDLLAAAASGLASGIVLKLIQVLVQRL